MMHTYLFFHFFSFFFFFNDTATTEIYTLSLHDALPILGRVRHSGHRLPDRQDPLEPRNWPGGDRKSTRLNSSHANISYAVFCLKKKKKKKTKTNKANKRKKRRHKKHKVNNRLLETLRRA